MCLILLAQKVHPDYPLIILFNRDEQYTRPTQPLSYWPEHAIYGGRDLVGEGTWLAIQASGRFALVTNVHSNQPNVASFTSRGLLVSDYLSTDISPLIYLQQIRRHRAEFNPFNLICGDLQSIYYYCNETDETMEINKGLYGLSNAFLETPWPKVERAKKLFRPILAQPVIAVTDCLFVLADRQIPPPQQDAHDAIFVVGTEHGTRSSSVIRVSNTGEVLFHEESFRPRGEAERSTEMMFYLNAADH